MHLSTLSYLRYLTSSLHNINPITVLAIDSPRLQMTCLEAKHSSWAHPQPEVCFATIAFLAIDSVHEDQVSIKETLSDSLCSIAILAQFLRFEELAHY